MWNKAQPDPTFLQAVCSACHLILAGFSLGLILDPENGSDVFLRNVRCLLAAYTSQKTKLFIITAVSISDPQNEVV
jgi:hypothetical protein